MAFLSHSLTFVSLISYIAALQVTPNSPCASFCVDSNDLDFSDPNSSTTGSEDITCYDSDYSASSAGQKFQRCISCLQDSTFSQGSENDQLWFLYNLRYTFDYCIFSFPNATEIASTPCSTSTACGQLETALTDGLLDLNNLDYSYCAVDGGAMTSELIPKCVSCVAASDDQGFLANYLTALEAGCQQQPPTGTLIGLNDTVFSRTAIGAIDPNSETSSDDNESALSITQIVGIAVGSIVIILAVAGFWFVCHRKRRNRRLVLGGNPSGKRGRRRPTSPLSFRCQTHLSPRSPAFFHNSSDSATDEEKVSSLALGSHPISSSAAWGSQTTITARGKPSFRSFSGHESASHLPLQSITTSATPAVPGTVHYSTSPKAARFSPVDVDEATPVSTTSTKSTAQLLPLRSYNPAEYGLVGSNMSSATAPAADGGGPYSAYASPTSGSTASPLLSRAWEQHQQQSRATAPAWDMPPRRSSRPSITATKVGGALERAAGVVVAGTGGRGGRFSVGGGSGGGNTGSPVESRQINMSFPGPPTGR
ncbi:hypothetical protein F5X99DRAFT_428747 [Biscogniauxia marginata]|nr:hypothetical protein F5X99DRAFT_428747 [Biscogniauxia marginata]